MKRFVLACVVLAALKSGALAALPPDQLVGVRVWIGSATLDGYTAYSPADAIQMHNDNPSLEEFLAYNMKLGKEMRFFTELRRVKFPRQMFVSAAQPLQLIPFRLITKWQRLPSALDGSAIDLPTNTVSFLGVELLQQSPLFSCVQRDETGTNWLSYNPKWNEDTMKELCQDPNSAKGKAVRNYLRAAVPDVIELDTPPDD